MPEILPLIPYPQNVQILPGSFEWSSKLSLFADEYGCELKMFLEALPDSIRPALAEKDTASYLEFQLNPHLNLETYQLKILSDQQILIVAGSSKGIFYALQTLSQLILADYHPESQVVTIPCLEIIDEPRFSWRGFMLDEARHFQGMQTVKDLLDWMAYFKMNVFHWHLTEDQGWRIEIKRYPRLVEVGAQRESSQISGFFGRKLNHTPHAGYYTQDEIREIVQYAMDRHIQIVPEIEMPGHAQAALAAYPELGCTGGPYQVSPHWGIHADILCPGKPGTSEFLKNVLAEVVELFPSTYIHTGGDEAPKKRWRNCPDCQKLAQAHHLEKINGLQTILTNDLAEFLRSHRRTLIGWNEMLADDLTPDAVVQYWVGREKTLLNHIRSGRKAILSNFVAYYLDHSYAHSPLDKVYQYEPVFEQLEPEYRKNILGIEAPLWTEFVPNRARLDWQTFPRLLAVAETAWLDPDKKSLESFHQRLPVFLDQLDGQEVGYALLEDANPSVIKRSFGSVTLVQAGKGVREKT